MTAPGGSGAKFRARLPATSANLGPGFDVLGLALSLSLSVEAEAAPEMSLSATGRDAELCGRMENNLLLMTYSEVLGGMGLAAPPIALSLHNGIPLGMGCGSSAAAICAGVLLANHFGQLRWSGQQMLDEACRREGHPDNVAACLLGYMTVARSTHGGRVVSATLGADLPWRVLLALPRVSLATHHARSLLPEGYSRQDAVTNLGSAALLTAAFALGRGDLLAFAMEDRLHQPYRADACPLLGRLLPLRERKDVLGVALSGAGPAVLVLTDGEATEDLRKAVELAAGRDLGELLEARIVPGALADAPGSRNDLRGM